MNQTRLRMADQMTRAQALRLRQLSEEAYQPRQFEPELTKAEALSRIAALEQEIALADSF